MDQKLLLLAALLGAASLSFAQTDSVRLSDVVVTGTRYQSDIRHLPLRCRDSSSPHAASSATD